MKAHESFAKFAIAYLIFSVTFFGAFFYDFYSTYASTEPRCTRAHLIMYVAQMDEASQIEYQQWKVSGGGIGIWGATSLKHSNDAEIRKAVFSAISISGCSDTIRDLVWGMRSSLLSHDNARYMTYRNALVKVID